MTRLDNHVYFRHKGNLSFKEYLWMTVKPLLIGLGAMLSLVITASAFIKGYYIAASTFGIAGAGLFLWSKSIQDYNKWDQGID